MPKISFSFGAAIGIHILVFLLSGFLIDKEETNIFNSRNLIDVHFGNVASTPKGNSSPKQIAKSPTKENSFEGKSISMNTASESTGAGDESSANDYFEASIVNYEGPSYPRIAQVRGIQGNIRVRLKISPEGMPQDISILKSTGHDVLDKAALEAILHWRFQKKNSAYFVEKNIVFQLKD